MDGVGNALTVDYLLGRLRFDLHDPQLPGTADNPDEPDADSLWSDTFLLDALDDAQTNVARRTWCIADVMDVPIEGGTDTYKVPSSIIHVRKARLVTADRELYIAPIDAVPLHNDYGWSTTIASDELTFDEKSEQVRLLKVPVDDDTLRLYVFRLPKTPIRDCGCALELHALRYKAALLAWARRQAYNVHDAETYDPKLRQQAEDDFEREINTLYPEIRARRRHGGTVRYGGL